MKYYIIAGEASGDLHASNLMHELSILDSNANYRCWGGDMMETQGGNIVKHYRDLAFMGFAEVVMNIRTIARNLAFCKRDIVKFNPDVLILIDYPGFNLRIASFAKKQGIKTFYYISPQIWAWKKSRVHAIKRDIDKVFCILPFEKDFYAKYNYNADYVGHPLLDALRKYHDAKTTESPALISLKQTDSRPIIALLPGSRKQEITKVLPVMVDATKHFPQYKFIIAGVKWQPKELYQNIIGDKQIPIIWDETYSLLKQSYAALVTSGTATLETALFNIPQVVLYQANGISYAIAKQIVKGISFISLPNLIMDKAMVVELIQQECCLKNVVSELEMITTNIENREKMLIEYELLAQKLGNGNASLKTAKIIYEELSLTK
ncbi:MAG: lipid-A-disaccharide synthase [Bacteroidota bacterium]